MGYGQLDGCGNCIKYGMFVTNALTFLGGLVSIALGIWSLTDKAFANRLLGTNLYSGAIYVLLSMGILICFVSCLGCFGSIKEVRSLLVAYFICVFLVFLIMLIGGILGYVFRGKYFICVFLVFIIMLIGGILGYVFRGKVENILEYAMFSSLSRYGNYKPVTDAWDETQYRLQCCGVRAPADWDFKVPDSCCREASPGVRQPCQQVTQIDPNVMYTEGCLYVTKKLVKEHAVVIGTAGIVVACIALLGMVLSCALYKKIRY